MEGWNDFFVAQIGASAALLGLLFVAVSLNLSRILSLPSLPDRALVALGLLLVILIVSSLMLVPGQPALARGGALVVVGGALLLAGARLLLRHPGEPGAIKRTVNLVLFVLATAPYVAAGAALLAGLPGLGMLLVAIAIVLSFGKAVLDAWVLLIEINR